MIRVVTAVFLVLCSAAAAAGEGRDGQLGAIRALGFSNRVARQIIRARPDVARYLATPHGVLEAVHPKVLDRDGRVKVWRAEGSKEAVRLYRGLYFHTLAEYSSEVTLAHLLEWKGGCWSTTHAGHALWHAKYCKDATRFPRFYTEQLVVGYELPLSFLGWNRKQIAAWRAGEAVEASFSRVLAPDELPFVRRYGIRPEGVTKDELTVDNLRWLDPARFLRLRDAPSDQP
jgi:hypothetical protein